MAKRIPTHTTDELNDAAIAAQTGGERERDLLIRMMRPYVVAIIRKIKGDYRRDERAEMEQSGYIGVLEALEKFDPDRGVKFSTFAWYHIQDKVFEWMGANSGAIAVPKTAWKYARIVEQQLYETDPTKHPTEFSDEEAAKHGPYGNLAYAGDLFRARSAPYSLDIERDTEPVSAVEEELFGTPAAEGSKRRGVSQAQEQAVLGFVALYDELHEDERFTATLEFCAEQGLPYEAAMTLMEVAGS